jgi:glycosyltransferase involved in cell wall biosynthesis
VLEEIDRADALVLPSSVETFGTAALEALARRRYVLVRPECGIFKWPTLSKGLFKIAADESLSRSITRLRSMPRERRDAVASESWQAVRDFNRYTVGVWLRFLSDAAATTAGGN